MARLFLIAMSLVLMGCAGGQKITDYSKLSVVYGWIDIRDIPGNTLNAFTMRNLSAPRNERFAGMGWEKMGNGYLVWHNGFPPGRFELDTMQTMTCAGSFILCAGNINEYGFGRDGTSPVRTIVSGPGVKFIGCYKFDRTKRGFFGPGEFDTRKTKCGASQRQMLSVMLKSAPPAHPIVAERIKREMR